MCFFVDFCVSSVGLCVCGLFQVFIPLFGVFYVFISVFLVLTHVCGLFHVFLPLFCMFHNVDFCVSNINLGIDHINWCVLDVDFWGLFTCVI